jgi:hypothetical protein
MPNVEKLPDRKAQAALETLEQAWSYYQPEPLPAAARPEAPQDRELFPYYTAA